MKIACQSCQAKYTIADEKVLGKVVKIRCKKCSATIVINGNDSQGAAAGGGGADSGVVDYTGPSSNEQWTVNVADGDQRTMSVAEIANEYRAGVVNDETYCWKDGMADWLPLREIEALYRLCSMAPQPSLIDAGNSVRPPAMGGGGADAALFGGTDAAPPNGGALFGSNESPAPAAARRAGGRGGGGADLFGGVAQAGGEEDVMSSAAAKPAPAAAAGGAAAASAAASDKLTGQRNENSVLFSLAALTTNAKDAPPPPPKNGDRTTAQADGSGLIDIRALSANMSKDDKGGKNHVDDIMNLSGGGAFGAALAAPILAPPPVADIPGVGGDAPKKDNTMLIAILGAGGLVAVAIIVAVILLRPGTPPAGVATNGSAGGPMPSMTLAMNDPTAPPNGAGGTGGGTTAPAPTDTGATAPGTQAAAPGQNNKPASPVNPVKPAGGGGGGGGATTTPAKPAGGGGGGGGGGTDTPATPPKPAGGGGGGGSLDDALRNAAGAPPTPAAPPPSTSDSPFDRGAAAATLGGVNFQSCKKPDGPTGGGHVTVTFGNNGSVQSAVVDQPPFAGTPVGGCIAGKFRSAHVPAFGGSPVKVGKSFNLN